MKRKTEMTMTVTLTVDEVQKDPEHAAYMLRRASAENFAVTKKLEAFETVLAALDRTRFEGFAPAEFSVLWRDRAEAAEQEVKEKTESVVETLAYVDKSLDNVADLDPDLTWTNTEVIQVLEDIRSLLVTGSIAPGMFEQQRSPHDGTAEPATKIGGQS